MTHCLIMAVLKIDKHPKLLLTYSEDSGHTAGWFESSLWYIYAYANVYELQRSKTYLWTCTPSKDSEKAFAVFTGHILDSQGCKVCSSGQRRRLSDCTDAQADLSLPTTHKSEGTFSHLTAPVFSRCGFMKPIIVNGTPPQCCILFLLIESQSR